MVKFFFQKYNIPTRKDIEKLHLRLDHIEQLITNIAETSQNKRVPYRKGIKTLSTRSRPTVTASDKVLDIIRDFDDGVKFPEIQARSGFEEKKLRNIIYRLNKIGKISRVSRGIYTAH